MEVFFSSVVVTGLVHDYSFSVFSERKKEMGVLIRGGRGVSHKRTSFIDFRSAFFLGCVRGVIFGVVHKDLAVECTVKRHLTTRILTSTH